jgi:hypothetical protein
VKASGGGVADAAAIKFEVSNATRWHAGMGNLLLRMNCKKCVGTTCACARSLGRACAFVCVYAHDSVRVCMWVRAGEDVRVTGE